MANAKKDAQVNVSYADPNNEAYVSVSGAARTFRDPAKARELWNSGARRWFPEGPDDPRLMILKVEIVQAEYWDVDKRAMIRLWIMVRAEQKSCRRPITRSFRK